MCKSRQCSANNRSSPLIGFLQNSWSGIAENWDLLCVFFPKQLKASKFQAVPGLLGIPPSFGFVLVFLLRAVNLQRTNHKGGDAYLWLRLSLTHLHFGDVFSCQHDGQQRVPSKHTRRCMSILKVPFTHCHVILSQDRPPLDEWACLHNKTPRVLGCVQHRLLIRQLILQK